MPRIWPASQIRELIAIAERFGEASATLESEEDALRFRFAIYTFRKQNSIGENLIITASGTQVMLHKPKVPSVHIDVPGTLEEEGE